MNPSEVISIGCNKGGVTHIQDQALLADNNVAVGQTSLGTYLASFYEYMIAKAINSRITTKKRGCYQRNRLAWHQSQYLQPNDPGSSSEKEEFYRNQWPKKKLTPLFGTPRMRQS
jgi:hypothetical protein